jgi:hypothetical protein
MKAIIYNTEAEAATAQQACAAIPQGSTQQLGNAPAPRILPYTTFFKHPSEDKWALIADQQVELLLGLPSAQLDASWIPPMYSVQGPWSPDQ